MNALINIWKKLETEKLSHFAAGRRFDLYQLKIQNYFHSRGIDSRTCIFEPIDYFNVHKTDEKYSFRTQDGSFIFPLFGDLNQGGKSPVAVED